MSDDIASIGIKVETDSVDGAVKSLDALAGQGPKVEKSLQGVEASATKTGKSLSNLGGGSAEASLGKVSKASAEAAKGVDKIGVSAGQTAQALRQLPSQLQDFIIQLQGGQSFLTAFSQQGSQIATSFGGVGNAVRSVASLISPLAAGIGALAAVGGTLALAYNQGANEAQAFARALILSGNAAGSTVGQLQELAQAQIKVVGTQGAAAEALAKLAGTGQVAGQGLSAAAEAAVRLSRVGVDIDDVVNKFAALGKDPLKALVALNEKENFLTVAVYKQVKALEEQGRAAEAAALAQAEYARVGISRASALEQQLGTLQKAWISVGDFAKKAWDRMLNVGRATTVEDQLKDVEKQLATLDEEFARKRRPTLGRSITTADQDAEALRKRRNELQQLAVGLSKKLDIERLNAQAEAAGAEAVKASIKADDDKKKSLKTLGDAFADVRDAAKEWADAFMDFGLIAREAEASSLGLSRGQARLLEYLTSPGYAKATEAMKQLALQEAYGAIAAEQNAKAQKEAADAIKKQREEAANALKGIRDRLTQLDLENAASVIAQKGNVSLAEAINKVTIARLKDKAAGLQDGSEAKQAILDQIEAYKALGEQLSAKELNDFLDPARAQTFGQALTGAFEQAGSSLAKLSGSLKEYADNQRQISANMARLGSEADPAERARKSLLLQNKAQENSIALYANMAGAAKGFFREGTKGYKALEAAETAFRLVQLASDLQKGLSAAAVGIANQAQGDPYSAFPRMAAMAAAMAALGFAVGGFGGGGSSGGGDGAPVATGTGTVLGDSSAKSESLTRALSQLADTAKLQLTTQSGMLSALRNIENNIGGLASLVVRGNTLSDSGVQTGTTLSLADPFTRSLFGKIGDSFTTKIFEALFGKKITVTGQGLSIGSATLGQINAGGVDLSNYTDVNSKQKFFGITVSNKNSTNYSPADPLLEQQFTKVFQSLYSGILSASGPLGLAFDQVKAQLDGFVLNIGKIDLSGLNGTQITEKLTAIIGAAADSISTAAIPGLQDFQKVGEGYFETLVRVASGVETAKDDLSRLGIVAINYTDVIRKQGDVAAEIVRQSIAAFESADGTLSSVGALINNLDASADDLAGTYKALVGVRDTLLAVGESGDSLTASMLQGAGGLDELANSLSTYLGGKFFSDQERASAALASLQSQFARIGIQTVPQTYEQFRTLVDSIDTTTDAGQRLYGQVIGLAGAFQTAQDAAEKASTTVASRLPDILKSQASERNGLMVDLLKAQGDAAGAAALKRSQDLATLTAGLSAAEAEAATAGYDYIASLRAQIDATNAAAQAATQAAAAEAQRAAAVASERTSLETQLLQAQGDTAALRARELQSLDPSNRALQERLYLLADEQAAADAAAQAAKDLADKLTAIATERDGIQSRIDELLGNTAAIRSRELATLDESNRALQERLYALQDEQAAAQAAAQAAQQLADQQAAAAKELADQQAAIARERFGLEGQLMQLLGDTAGLRARELAALDPSNRALQEKIYALLDEKEAQQRAAEAAQAAAQAAQDAARAAEQMRAAWQSVTDSLFEEVKRIRDLMSGNGQQSLASAQAQFAITTAQARAGDQEAAKLLPGLSQTLLQLAEANAGSLLDLQRIRAQIAASLEQTGAGFIARFGLTLPKFAVGTNYVPRDMAAIVHEGEAIVPRAYNPAASGGGANGAASGALLQEVAGLREDNQAQALAIVKLQTEISRLLKKWDSDGIPEERKVAA